MSKTGLAILCLAITACMGGGRDYSEASVAGLHDQLQRGDLTSERLVEWYIQRIETIDYAGPQLNSMIEINPDALNIARALDAEWKTPPTIMILLVPKQITLATQVASLPRCSNSSVPVSNSRPRATC